MDQEALRVLREWAPTHDIPHVSACPAYPPKLQHNVAGLGSFVACATYQLPDGGRFRLLLSGTIAEKTLMPLVENDLGLPDGFLIDINTYLLTDLTAEGPLSAEKLLKATLRRANLLYQKHAFSAPKEAEPKLSSPESGLSEFGMKRRRTHFDSYTPPQFGPNRLATTTLMKQITLLKEINTRKDGYIAEPVDDDLYTWNVKLYFDEVDSSLSSDLAKLPDHDFIKMEFRFPSDYPTTPPIVRVVSPHVRGGHVAPHGGICMELLTTSGWAPVNSIDVVCIQIRAMLVQGGARIQASHQALVSNYTFRGAMEDLKFIVLRHHWNVPQSRSRLPSS